MDANNFVRAKNILLTLIQTGFQIMENLLYISFISQYAEKISTNQSQHLRKEVTISTNQACCIENLYSWLSVQS